jgi:rod shape-determining protein MreB
MFQKILKKIQNIVSFFRLPADICIDLGTANTLIYVKGQGIVLNEPSVVAVQVYGSEKNRILAVGNEAKMMVGRTPASITAIYPMKDGVIADYSSAEEMIKAFIKKANRRALLTSRVLICTPYGATEVDKRAIRDSAIAAGARKVILVDEPLAAGIGANLPVNQAKGTMIVDIGGGTTEIAVISLGGIAAAASHKVAGYKMDEAIKDYISNCFNIKIGDSTAEQLKKELGFVYGDSKKQLAIRGFDAYTCTPKEVIITSEHIRESLNPLLKSIGDAIKKIFDNREVGYDLCGDIARDGIVLSGGGALLSGLDKFLSDYTGLEVKVAENPLLCVIKGLEIIAEINKILPETNMNI